MQADLVSPVTVKNWPQVDTRSREYNYIRAKVRAITGSAVDYAELPGRWRSLSAYVGSASGTGRGRLGGYDGTGVGNINRFRELNFSRSS